MNKSIISNSRISSFFTSVYRQFLSLDSQAMVVSTLKTAVCATPDCGTPIEPKYTYCYRCGVARGDVAPPRGGYVARRRSQVGTVKGAYVVKPAEQCEVTGCTNLKATGSAFCSVHTTRINKEDTVPPVNTIPRIPRACSKQDCAEPASHLTGMCVKHSVEAMLQETVMPEHVPMTDPQPIPVAPEPVLTSIEAVLQETERLAPLVQPTPVAPEPVPPTGGMGVKTCSTAGCGKAVMNASVDTCIYHTPAVPKRTHSKDAPLGRCPKCNTKWRPRRMTCSTCGNTEGAPWTQADKDEARKQRGRKSGDTRIANNRNKTATPAVPAQPGAASVAPIVDDSEDMDFGEPVAGDGVCAISGCETENQDGLPFCLDHMEAMYAGGTCSTDFACNEAHLPDDYGCEEHSVLRFIDADGKGTTEEPETAPAMAALPLTYCVVEGCSNPALPAHHFCAEHARACSDRGMCGVEKTCRKPPEDRTVSFGCNDHFVPMPIMPDGAEYTADNLPKMKQQQPQAGGAGAPGAPQQGTPGEQGEQGEAGDDAGGESGEQPQADAMNEDAAPPEKVEDPMDVVARATMAERKQAIEKCADEHIMPTKENVAKKLKEMWGETPTPPATPPVTPAPGPAGTPPVASPAAATPPPAPAAPLTEEEKQAAAAKAAEAKAAEAKAKEQEKEKRELQKEFKKLNRDQRILEMACRGAGDILTHGPSGVGKTRYAYVCTRKYFDFMARIQFEPNTTALQIFGGVVKTTSGFDWADGRILDAIKAAQAGKRVLLLLDELARGPRTLQSEVMPILNKYDDQQLRDEGYDIDTHMSVQPNVVWPAYGQRGPWRVLTVVEQQMTYIVSVWHLKIWATANLGDKFEGQGLEDMAFRTRWETFRHIKPQTEQEMDAILMTHLAPNIPARLSPDGAKELVKAVLTCHKNVSTFNDKVADSLVGETNLRSLMTWTTAILDEVDLGTPLKEAFVLCAEAGWVDMLIPIVGDRPDQELYNGVMEALTEAAKLFTLAK